MAGESQPGMAKDGLVDKANKLIHEGTALNQKANEILANPENQNLMEELTTLLNNSAAWLTSARPILDESSLQAEYRNVIQALGDAISTTLSIILEKTAK